MNINPSAVDAIAAAEDIASAIATAANAAIAAATNAAIAADSATNAAASAAKTATATNAAIAANSAANAAASTADTAVNAAASAAANSTISTHASSTTDANATIAANATNSVANAAIAAIADVIIPILPQHENFFAAGDDTTATTGNLLHGYNIEGINDVPPHVHRHAVAFYNKLIPIFEAATATYQIIDCAKYNQCSCKKAGRTCSSACHRNNFKCVNHDRVKD